MTIIIAILVLGALYQGIRFFLTPERKAGFSFISSAHAQDDRSVDHTELRGAGLQRFEDVLAELNDAGLMVGIVTVPSWASVNTDQRLMSVGCKIAFYDRRDGARIFLLYGSSDDTGAAGYQLMRYERDGFIIRLYTVYSTGVIFSPGHARHIADRDTTAAGACYDFMLAHTELFGIDRVWQ